MIKIIKEMDLLDFEPWSGACETFARLDEKDIEILEDYMNEFWENITETDINDFLWHEIDAIEAILGRELY